jgi:hypothetical protein
MGCKVRWEDDIGMKIKKKAFGVASSVLHDSEPSL